MEVASHLIKGPHPSMSNDAEYIVVNKYLPSFVKVDSVESNHSPRGWWAPGISNPVTIVIILMVITILICGPICCLFIK